MAAMGSDNAVEHRMQHLNGCAKILQARIHQVLLGWEAVGLRCCDSKLRTEISTLAYGKLDLVQGDRENMLAHMPPHGRYWYVCCGSQGGALTFSLGSFMIAESVCHLSPRILECVLIILSIPRAHAHMPP